MLLARPISSCRARRPQERVDWLLQGIHPGQSVLRCPRGTAQCTREDAASALCSLLAGLCRAKLAAETCCMKTNTNSATFEQIYFLFRSVNAHVPVPRAYLSVFCSITCEFNMLHQHANGNNLTISLLMVLSVYDCMRYASHGTGVAGIIN